MVSEVDEIISQDNVEGSNPDLGRKITQKLKVEPKLKLTSGPYVKDASIQVNRNATKME